MCCVPLSASKWSNEASKAKVASHYKAPRVLSAWSLQGAPRKNFTQCKIPWSPPKNENPSFKLLTHLSKHKGKTVMSSAKVKRISLNSHSNNNVEAGKKTTTLCINIELYMKCVCEYFKVVQILSGPKVHLADAACSSQWHQQDPEGKVSSLTEGWITMT